MSTITIDGKEYNKEKVLKLIEENKEVFDVKPLTLGYATMLDILEGALKRLNALIKIREWKEENDNGIGAYWYIVFAIPEGKFYVAGSDATYANPDLPRFSSSKIAERALTELEQEYKIVFNVK